MNVRKLIARIHRATRDIAPGKVGHQDMVDMLNEGLYSLATVTNKVTVLEYMVDPLANSLPFPEDYLRFSNIYWGNDQRELRLSEKKTLQSDGTSTGDPHSCYIEDGRFVLYPTPLHGGKAYVEYVKQPIELKKDTDEPDIENSDEYLVAHVVRQIYFDLGDSKFQYWDMEKMRALAMFANTTEDTYQTPFRVIATW